MSELTLSGSCLCGSVQFEVTGKDPKFYHCHCERCRKASGTGHMSNIIVVTDAVRFTAGESLLKRYDVPEAKRFATVFCSNCGSLLPRVSQAAGIVVIPAGALDQRFSRVWLMHGGGDNVSWVSHAGRKHIENETLRPEEIAVDGDLESHLDLIHVVGSHVRSISLFRLALIIPKLRDFAPSCGSHRSPGRPANGAATSQRW